jgi:hypothetical protein
MVPIIIAPARPRSVGDNRAGRGANQPARNHGAGRVASQAADKRAGAATDQCAAQHAIVPPVRTPSERQCHRYHDQCLAHPLSLSNWKPPPLGLGAFSPSDRGFAVRAVSLYDQDIPISSARIA